MPNVMSQRWVEVEKKEGRNISKDQLDNRERETESTAFQSWLLSQLSSTHQQQED